MTRCSTNRKRMNVMADVKVIKTAAETALAQAYAQARAALARRR